jgi:NDP-sugar pyrophosphorylase family protein
MNLMKGVILTAGKGTRLLPLTKDISKCMLPIGGKSIVKRSLDIMSEFEFMEEICILTNKDNLKQIKENYGEEYKNKKIVYIIQDIEKYGMGTASAILSAKEFIGDEIALIMAGDIIVDTKDVKEMVMKYKDENVNVMLLKTVPDPHNFGIVILNGNDRVIDIEEKPEKPKSDLINGSVYLFAAGDMKYLENINLSKRNEYEVTDALTKMSLEGKLYGFTAKGYWDDVGTPLAVLRSNEELMKKNKNNIIEENVEIENSEIQEPCFIGKNSKLKNVKIKPYTFIGENCVLENSEIENSIVLEKSKIVDTNLKNCLIGTENTFEKVEIKVEKETFGCVSGPNISLKERKIEQETKI